LVCSLFSMCSHQVPNGFPSIFHGNPQVLNVFLHMFLIAPHFYTICFAQSCPLLNYIAGPSCNLPNFQRDKCIWQRSWSFRFLFLMGQSKWFIAKMKVKLGKHPI
jgi:hypothetical protein